MTRKSDWWISLDEMKNVCPSCAERMQELGLKSVNVEELLKRAPRGDIPEPLLRGLCKKIGPDEPGVADWMNRCLDASFGDFDPGDKGKFCSWLHVQCTGVEPAEHRSVDIKDMHVEGPNLGYIAGATSFAELEAEQTAHYLLSETVDLIQNFSTLMGNILADPEIEDKRAALANLAYEFVDLVEDEVDEATSVSEKAMITDPIVANSLLTVKSLGKNRIGGYCVLWGDEEHKDLTDEFFTPDTSELTTIFDGVGRLPYIYHHSMDDALKSRVMGVVDVMKTDDIGLWFEAQMKMADDYDSALRKLIHLGKIRTSTQTFATARAVSENGFIQRWPIIEISGTPTPAEPRMRSVTEIGKAYEIIGKSLDDVVRILGIDSTVRLPDEAEKIRLLASLKEERLALENL